MNPRNIALSPWVGLWTALPSRPDNEFKEIIKGFTCGVKLKMASVCKSWLKFIQCDEMGEQPLTERNFQPRFGCSWMSICSTYLKLPQTIVAVDKSGSMNDILPNGKGFSNLEIAIKKSCKIIADLGPALSMNGVDCIVFGNTTATLKVFLLEDALKFFSSKHPTGMGTDSRLVWKNIRNSK